MTAEYWGGAAVGAGGPENSRSGWAKFTTTHYLWTTSVSGHNSPRPNTCGQKSGRSTTPLSAEVEGEIGWWGNEPENVQGEGEASQVISKTQIHEYLPVSVWIHVRIQALLPP